MRELVLGVLVLSLCSACSESSSGVEDGRVGVEAGSPDAGADGATDAARADGVPVDAANQGDRATVDGDNPPPLPVGCDEPLPTTGLVWVATDGDDTSGTGSEGAPFATIARALEGLADGSTVVVQAGTYSGRIRLRGDFSAGVTVRAEVPYTARLRHDDTVITAYGSNAAPVRGITIMGFDIAHSGAGSAPLVVHIDGNGEGAVSHITLRNNILHDSYDNDILKINNSTHHVTVERNLFYNQTGSDEHIDVNSVSDVVIQDNVFFNDFAASGRQNNNDTSSYIVVKDSNGGGDLYQGSTKITIRRNIFFNWQGNTGTSFVLLGEDGNPYYEARDVLLENNLMLGNSDNGMRAAFGVKGCQDVTFRNNTVVGDLPSLAFAMRINQEGQNPVNRRISFHNNIWADPSGTMGQLTGSDNPDFSDTPIGQSEDVVLDHNLYFNGGQPIPTDSNEAVNYTDDANAVVGDPELGSQSGLVTPTWQQDSARFADGSATICEAFLRLVESYGKPNGGAAIGAGDPAHAATDDILGRARGGSVDIGAYQP